MTTQTSTDESVFLREGSISNSNRTVVVDQSKAFWLTIIASVNLVGTLAMFAEWRIAERESRLLEYYVMELDGKLMSAGFIKFNESWSYRNQHNEEQKK